ncbi:hypothetical protein [Streptomyces nodosus]|uniref:Uncharacterized protein n=1 Tax=Streptomyces nodosus TaxID=40318 RepID=A0A0B5DT09_9ACTN|nr:hypothetical protein [Streptomyces nodosus]AJE43222.1 hypothetical protein SNOD_26745 [Streptomyces nodosus]MBB4794643.1 hypothetical protein [Streptomyces nodosus]QEV41723.1 hypothetical protein CP978_27040 [Streptomyces nodosus]
MKSSIKAVALTALAACSILAGTAQASAADTQSDVKPMKWVGPAVRSDEAPAGKVAHYEANPETGTITFLGFVPSEPEFSTLITEHNPAQSGDCVLAPTGVPYASFGFRGAGTLNGNWQNRKRITGGTEGCAGTYHAQSGGSNFNTPILAPGAFIDFTAAAVFTQIRI